MFNIVEGCGASSPKDFARFLDHSIKSSSELESQLELARDYGVLPNRQYRELAAEAVEIRRMICGYRSKLLITARVGDKSSG
jgi:four helix bundle protein